MFNRVKVSEGKYDGSCATTGPSEVFVVFQVGVLLCSPG